MANHLAAFGKRDYFHQKKRHAYNECGQQAFVAVDFNWRMQNKERI
jgi:hypothetical protein